MKLHRFTKTIGAFALVILFFDALSTSGCKSQVRIPQTVPVEFEIQLINARASSYGFGQRGGNARAGFGATNEKLTHSAQLSIGDPVFCKVVGEQWDRSQPAHQVLCRISVEGEEIYICGGQGTHERDAKAECGGPVYIPQKDKNRG